MKAKLRVHVAYHDLFKEIEIEFAPSLGMIIELDPETHNEVRLKIYRESLNKHGTAVTPLFTVNAVKYRVKDGSLSVDISLAKPQEADSLTAIEQLVYGFGFMTWAEMPLGS